MLHYIPTPQNGKRIVTKRICHFRTALLLWPFVASKFSWKHIIAQTLFAQLDELECRKREKKKDMIISLTFFYRHIWLGWPLVLNLKTLNWTANKSLFLLFYIWSSPSFGKYIKWWHVHCALKYVGESYFFKNFLKKTLYYYTQFHKIKLHSKVLLWTYQTLDFVLFRFLKETQERRKVVGFVV